MSKKKKSKSPAPGAKGVPQTTKEVLVATKPVQPEAAASSFDRFFERPWLLSALLVAATVAVYAVSLQNGFMVFDDDRAIRYNTVIKNPTFQGIFFSNNLGMYAPVTWLGYALVYAVAGEDATAFHAFSLLLHIGCVLTLFALLRLLQPKREIAFFAALLFAVHPMQVEATSWIAGQSALTFSFFYLLGMLAYAHWQRNNRPVFYALTFLAFVLSVLAKSAAVTLPLMLLALDWYRQGHLTFRNILGKTPFFLGSLAFGLYTFATREAEGHDLVVSSKAYNMLDRFLMVCHSLLFYPVQLLAPFRLSIFYPMEKSNGTWPIDYYLAPLILGALAWLTWKYALKLRIAGLSALWYLLPLLVMLPYVSVGTFEMRSDRYVYISSAGFFLLLVWMAQKMQPLHRRTLLLAAAALYGWLAYNRSLVWNNEVTVFRDCVEKHPDAALCNCNLAYGELLNLEFDNSILHYTNTLRLDPTYVEAYNGRGQAYFELKKFPEAFSDFDNAIKGGIATPKLYLNRGKCLVILNRSEEAIPDLAQSIELEPRNPETYYFKGMAEDKTGKFDAAVADYSRAIELQPRYVEALVNRGFIHFREKRLDDAIADYSAALAVRPDVFIALNNRAAAYFQKGMLNEALADASKAIEVQPNYLKAYETRASILTAMGRTAEAAKDLERVKK